jgi:SnoaL-like polyketide cyclase
MSPDENVHAVEAIVDAFGRGDIPYILDPRGAVRTADYIDHEAPPGTPGGPDGANAVLRWLRGAFSDLSYEVKDAFGFGDRVAVEPLTERAR